MLVPANYCFLYQELCLCLQVYKKLHHAPLSERFTDTSVKMIFSSNTKMILSVIPYFAK